MLEIPTLRGGEGWTCDPNPDPKPKPSEWEEPFEGPHRPTAHAGRMQLQRQMAPSRLAPQKQVSSLGQVGGRSASDAWPARFREEGSNPAVRC